jgi:hypothetical protein
MDNNEIDPDKKAHREKSIGKRWDEVIGSLEGTGLAVCLDCGIVKDRSEMIRRSYTCKECYNAK